MKTFILPYTTSVSSYKYQLLGIIFISLMVWWAVPKWFGDFSTMAFTDVSIWHLILLSLLLWLISQVLNAFAFRKLLQALRLPEVSSLISQFGTLTLWQKYILYLALFALWWLAMLLSLIAVL